jgi:aspartyl-tRNA(Asn)/glutamyl-tRNA(Gln) amidotransferase subunit B
MRSKEDAHDYRYFPDPDLLPLKLDYEFINRIAASLPELPDAIKARFMADYNLSEYDARILTADKTKSDFYEVVAKGRDAKIAANWTMVELFGALNKAGTDLEDSPVSADMLGGLIDRIADNTISGKIAKTVFEKMFAGEGSADDIIEKEGLKQVTDTGAIEAMVDEAIASNAAQAEKAKENSKLLGFFVGQVMKASQGKANPQAVNEILRKKLGL